MRKILSYPTQFIKHRLLKWLNKRVPASSEHHLNLNSIFILPTGFGWSFILLSICLFLLGTNYQNNLMLLLSYLCLSIMLLTLFYTHQNFARFAVKALPLHSFHCNQAGELQLHVLPHVNSPNKPCHGTLTFGWFGPHRSSTQSHGTQSFTQSSDALSKTTFSIPLSGNAFNKNSQRQTLSVPVYIKSRGRYMLNRLTIACDFPLGLYKCWTHLDFDQSVTVYPQPDDGPVSIEHITDNEESNSSSETSNANSNEDFYALNDYEPGQPLNRVSWKHVAKNGNWVSKSFTSRQSESYVLSIHSSIDTETAISALTLATIKLTEAEQNFGLSYKGIVVPPNKGINHMHDCLNALACFGKSENARQDSQRTTYSNIRAVK